jgi:molybdenum-dependent DNA-binding transcriptional regulator ModE
MSTEEKIIKTKLGILKLAQELGSVSQACKYFGYSRIASTGLKHYMNKEENRL